MFKIKSEDVDDRIVVITIKPTNKFKSNFSTLLPF